MNFFDWLGRVIMLALAGMITLSIIGAIAAIPDGIVPQQLGLERQTLPVPQDRQGDQPTPDLAETEADEERVVPAKAGARDTIAAPVPPKPVDPARWLEAMSYALLALAGLAAFACLLLWRGIRQQRRIADALEALSAAPRASSAPSS